ncbi:peptidase family C78-domain-containing protein [Podospora australis]|uniref:Peptidase family C78-domain-containing protein n=1 Tax=Podospora australis TaxID=1536484 RepID=A0AAN7ALF8_9PEZI|nr:peptidase family C78-domain-containing protein [Podospora australis]
MAGDRTECPFCGWSTPAGDPEMNQMLLHLETLHAEDEAQPSAAPVDKEKPKPASGSAHHSKAEDEDDDLQYVECSVDGCGEILALSQLEYHLELHEEEIDDRSSPETPVPPSSSSSVASGPSRSHREAERHRQSSDRKSEPSEKQSKAISVWKKIFKMTIPVPTRGSSRFTRHSHKSLLPNAPRKRLGRAHLGRYAHEDRMPEWLASMLKHHGQVRSKGVIPVIAQLLEQSPSTEYAYLCHPSVQHISKLKSEGGFCGYRNIQMLCSYLIYTKSAGSERLGDDIPSIFEIQDFIESAWDQGIQASGRIETGGIKGTRKYIGTPEALAMFRLLNIPCDAQGIKHKEPSWSEQLLLDYVEEYFQSGVLDPTQDVRRTSLPPLYFQHMGHSMTIIGIEKYRNGTRSLLVFDPCFRDASTTLKLVGKQFVHPKPDLALKPYRRGSRYLRAYKEFELLRYVHLIFGHCRLRTLKYVPGPDCFPC